MPSPNLYGIWGLGNMDNTAAVNKFLPAIRGYRFRFDWKDFETSRGTFANNALQSEFNKAINSNLYIDFQVFVAPTDENVPNNNSTPLYLFDPPDNVPLVHTDDPTINFFPYYFNANYKTRYFNFLDHVLSLLVGQTTANKAFFLSWESAEGTTGDTAPYKGNPDNPTYNISDNAWSNFKRSEIWSPYYDAYAAQMPNMRVSINPGNDGENFQWALDNISNVWLKQGHPTHTYSLSGELFYVNRLKTLAESAGAGLNNRVYGEFENTLNLAWWQNSTKQNLFAMLCSVCHHYIDMLNISSGNSQSIVNTDMTAYNFANKYMGVRTPQESKSAFVAFRQMIDVADTTKWSTGTYGDLIAPADLAAYTAAYNAITASSDPQTVKDQAYTTLLVSGNIGNTTYINSARLTALQNAFPDAEFHTIDDQQQQDAYSQEFGVYMIPDNYYRWLVQYSPDTTSEGIWRLGATNQLYGRYTRQFKITGGAGEMFFTLDPDLAFTGAPIKISITYYDSGSGKWSVNCATCKGKSELFVNQNTNTNTYKTVSFVSNYMVLGGHLAHASDITIKYLGGGNTQFALMEVDEVSSPIVPTLMNLGVTIHNACTQQRIDGTKLLDLKWARPDPIIINIFNPCNNPPCTNEYVPYIQQGINVIQNINQFPTGNTTDWVKPNQLTAYANNINEILDSYDPVFPSIVALENEELNNSYHNPDQSLNPIENYIGMLNTAIPLLKARGIQVINGGLPEQIVNMGVYLWIKNTLGDVPRANAYANVTLTAVQKNQADNYNNASLAKMDTLLDAYANMDLDFINIHLYYPWKSGQSGNPISPSEAFHTISDYIFARTGKQPISNETGIKINNNGLMTAYLDEYAAAGWNYIIYLNNDPSDANSSPVVTPGNLCGDGITITTLGTTMKGWADNYYG